MEAGVFIYIFMCVCINTHGCKVCICAHVYMDAGVCYVYIHVCVYMCTWVQSVCVHTHVHVKARHSGHQASSSVTLYLLF